MTDHTPTPDPVWLSRVLGALAVVLLTLWLICHPYLEWWASALLLVSGPIAAIEAYRVAWRAGGQQ